MFSFGQTPASIAEILKKQQGSIIEESINCATKYNYTIQMKEWQECLRPWIEKRQHPCLSMATKGNALFQSQKI